LLAVFNAAVEPIADSWSDGGAEATERGSLRVLGANGVGKEEVHKIKSCL
jgi:hypothetical protein